MVADPDLDQRFLDNCLACGLEDSPAGLNRSLFQLRKSGNLQSVPTTRRTEFSWADSDPYLFASEIAWRQMHDATQASMDQILCDPQLAQQFDQIARQFAPGFTSLQYRWAALKLRKAQQNARIRAMRLAPVEVPKGKPTCDQAGWMDLQGQPGLYVVSDGTKKHLYVGETFDLGRQLQHQFGNTPCHATWAEHGTDLKIGVLPSSHFQELSQLRQGASLGNWLVAYQFQLATQITPRLNSLGLESMV